MKNTSRLKKKQAKIYILRKSLTASPKSAYAKCTTLQSGFPRPSAIADFLCLLFTQALASYGGSIGGNKIPQGNTTSRLCTVVETRLPYQGANNKLNTKESVMTKKQTVEQIDKLNALQSQIQALLLTLLHSAESEHLTNVVAVNALWLALDRMEELATTFEAIQTEVLA